MPSDRGFDFDSQQERATAECFAQWKRDGHTDRQATFSHLQAALMLSLPIQIWLYEVWTPLAFNMLVRIDRTIDHKRSAINRYHSQLPQLNYREGFVGLSAYRSTFRPPA